MTEHTDTADAREPTDIHGSAAADEFGSAEDLRLVLEAISETSMDADGGSGSTSLSAGLMPYPDDKDSIFRSVFGHEPPAGLVVDVFSSAGSSVIIMEFDMSGVRAKLRPLIASGISNASEIAAFVGQIPSEVSERIDAARSDPRLAGHFIATAADHLAERVRHRLKDTLMPIIDDGTSLCWASDVPSSASEASRTHLWNGLNVVTPFASRVVIINGSDNRIAPDAE